MKKAKRLTQAGLIARAWTERWVRDWAYCPNCGNSQISSFPPNSPVADFFCPACSEQYELKAQKYKFSRKVLDGAFKTKTERLAADDNPSLFLLNYDLKQVAVTNFLIVPKHFFILDVIAERKPLAPTARRAGWIGSHILLDRIPEAGKIYIVKNGLLQSKEAVLDEWKKTLFLRDQRLEARG